MTKISCQSATEQLNEVKRLHAELLVQLEIFNDSAGSKEQMQSALLLAREYKLQLHTALRDFRF